MYDIDNLRFLGRAYLLNGKPGFDFNSAGFEFSFNGTGASATFSTQNGRDFKGDYPAFRCYVDGVKQHAPIILGEGETEVILCDGLARGKHTVKVVKRGMEIRSAAFLEDLNIFGGRFLPPPAAKEFRIEVIGDSISIGRVTLGDRGSTLSTHYIDDCTLTGCYLAAEWLDADVAITGMSGYGMVKNSSGNAEFTVPKIFDFASVYNKIKWDFARYQPNVTVINLGTNDAAAGVPEAEFKEKASEFLKHVRAVYPSTKIIYAYGAMGNRYEAVIKEVIAELADKGLSYLPLPQVTADKSSCGHPDAEMNLSYMKIFIKEITTVSGR